MYALRRMFERVRGVVACNVVSYELAISFVTRDVCSDSGILDHAGRSQPKSVATRSSMLKGDQSRSISLPCVCFLRPRLYCRM